MDLWWLIDTENFAKQEPKLVRSQEIVQSRKFYELTVLICVCKPGKHVQRSIIILLLVSKWHVAHPHSDTFLNSGLQLDAQTGAGMKTFPVELVSNSHVPAIETLGYYFRPPLLCFAAAVAIGSFTVSPKRWFGVSSSFRKRLKESRLTIRTDLNQILIYGSSNRKVVL